MPLLQLLFSIVDEVDWWTSLNNMGYLLVRHYSIISWQPTISEWESPVKALQQSIIAHNEKRWIETNHQKQKKISRIIMLVVFDRYLDWNFIMSYYFFHMFIYGSARCQSLYQPAWNTKIKSRYGWKRN